MNHIWRSGQGCQPVHHRQLSMESQQLYTVLTVLTALSPTLTLLLAEGIAFGGNKGSVSEACNLHMAKHSYNFSWSSSTEQYSC